MHSADAGDEEGAAEDGVGAATPHLDEHLGPGLQHGPQQTEKQNVHSLFYVLCSLVRDIICYAYVYCV